jgi:hypothetical protein
MNGPIGGVSVPGSTPNVAQTNEDLILDTLQSKAEQRFENMKETFQNLSPDDAKMVFDRLTQANSKDVLSTQFQKAFHTKESDQLLKVLSSKFQNAEPAPNMEQGPAQKADPRGGGALRNELSFQGNVLQAQMQGQLPVTVADVSKGAEKILENRNLNPQQKVAQLQKFLEGKNLTGEQIKELISNVSGRGAVDKELMAFAIGKSGQLMEAIQKGLPEADQVQVMNQIAGASVQNEKNVISGKLHNEVKDNIAKWSKSVSADTLNRVFADKDMPVGNAVRELAESTNLGNRLLPKLSDENKLQLINSHLSYTRVPEEQSGYLYNLFASLSPAGKNKAFDAIQDSGNMPKFLASQTNWFGKAHLDGLSRENLQFMVSTFEHLSKAAELKGDKQAAILYQEKILHVKGYMENHPG